MASQLVVPTHPAGDFEFDDIFFARQGLDEQPRSRRGSFVGEATDGHCKGQSTTISGPRTAKMKAKQMEDFIIVKHVGRGGYSRVYQVRESRTNKVYAMKLLKKSHLIRVEAVDNTLAERDILKRVKHPFIVRLHYTFQTADRLAFVMDFLGGGQLFFHLRKEAMLDEDTARFYTAELILALEYLHSHSIIHRDLKPENILLAADGHIVLTDFGLAKEEVHDEETGASTWCGTIEYMAPEMIRGLKYGKAADFWSVGILLFDMLYGKPPFRDKNPKKLGDMICNKKIVMPSFWRPETHAIIKGLTQREPKQRLKLAAIKSHAYFKGLRWADLLAKRLPPPMVPTITSDLDLAYFDASDLAYGTALSPAEPPTLPQVDPFAGFEYARSMTPTAPSALRLTPHLPTRGRAPSPGLVSPAPDVPQDTRTPLFARYCGAVSAEAPPAPNPMGPEYN